MNVYEENAALAFKFACKICLETEPIPTEMMTKKLKSTIPEQNGTSQPFFLTEIRLLSL